MSGVSHPNDNSREPKVDEDIALGKVLGLTGAGNMVGLTHHYLPILKEVTVPHKSPAHITGRRVTKV